MALRTVSIAIEARNIGTSHLTHVLQPLHDLDFPMEQGSCCLNVAVSPKIDHFDGERMAGRLIGCLEDCAKGPGAFEFAKPRDIFETSTLGRIEPGDVL